LSSHFVRERSDELEIYCKAWPVREGKHFSKQAFEAAKELDDVELMSAALARRGVTLIQQNKATAAIAYLHEAFGLMRSQLRFSGAFGAG
jgi:hypothetical protein